MEAGSQGATPIVLLHGASGNIRDWSLSILPDLAARHHVIALDRPGFGHSKSPRINALSLAHQVKALRAALHRMGHHRYILVGHSYGGSLAMRWALDHPDEVTGLALLSAPVKDWGGGGIGLHYQIGGRPVIGPALAWMAPILAGPRWVEAAIKEVFHPDAVPPSYPTEGGVELALRPHTFRINAVMMLRLYRDILDQCDRYGEINCPIEVVHGDADTIVPASIHAIPLADKIGHANLTILPGIGHMPHHAAPKEVAALIDRLAATVGEQTDADHIRRDDPAEDPVL
ncbi:MAG: alpha/beta hydrolase [Pseudomonadota bacterium]